MTNYRARLAKVTLFLAALGVAFSTTAAADASDTVQFASAPWPGVTVKTEVARQILDAAGYQTKEMNTSWTIALQAVARGSVDADLGIWMPTEKSTVEPLVKAKKIKLLVKNVPDAEYDLVVPDYVWKAGVHSIADLQAHAARFGNTIYGIEAGNDGNNIVKKAIKNNTYGLGDWHLQPSNAPFSLFSLTSVYPRYLISFPSS